MKCPRCGFAWRDKNEQFAVAAKRAQEAGFPNAFKPWRLEEDQKLVELLNEGKSLTEIAAVLGRQPSAIQRRKELLVAKIELVGVQGPAKPTTQTADDTPQVTERIERSL